MSSTAKCFPRRHTFFVWVTLIYVSLTAAVDLDIGTVWQRNQNLNLTLTVALRARSNLDCSVGCLHSSPCGSFCMGRSDNTCYLAVEKTSPVQVLDEFSDVRCFTKANCPTAAGYSAYGGRCLKLYPDNANYTTAQGRCSADGGHLYHYKSLAFDREPIRQLLDNSGFSWTAYYILWMGGDDLLNEGDFVWSDGSHLPINDPVWSDGEPNNGANGDEHCLTIYPLVYKLNDAYCPNEIYFVCQIDM